MEHVFGPVPSRRLGRSLGIDPIPLKTCNWNCIYCQLGRTSPPSRERGDFGVSAEDVVAEVRAFFAAHGPDAADWVTFVGSGEPTLHRHLGWMIREVKALTTLPVAVITNGSLLWDPRVRAALAAADAVMPTVSAGTERLYLRIHRPAHGLTFERFVEGLVAFRQAYEGRLWAEVMLLDGLNDGDDALAALAALLRRVAPDEIQIVLPTRPPSVADVAPACPAAVRRAARVLGDVAPVVVPTETPATGADDGALDDRLVGVVRRHPMTEEELARAMGVEDPAVLREALTRLRGEDRVQRVERCGRAYWTAAEARFGSRPGR